MKVSHNQSLKSYNTFGIDVSARTLIEIETLEDLQIILKRNYSGELFILGGGSNMLLTQDLDFTVLHINLKGKEKVAEDENFIYLKACAGENWHDFVLYTLNNNWGGLENLSLIPGNVGTSPIQNIGAYGVELKDVFHSCDAIDLQTLETISFSKEDCEFDYRNSVFKNNFKGKYIITSVIFKLTRNHHEIRANYGDINGKLAEMHIDSPKIKDISNAVIAIRRQKLPNWKELGNSGSFFKNPVISKVEYKILQTEFPEMPHYQVSENEIKIPGGWLIDKAGLKGFREGDAGVHKNQALVLVNYGEATGQDILKLSAKIQKKIFEKFRINLEPEVNII